MMEDKDKILAEFGKRLRDLRISNGYSTRKFADKADIAHATVEKLEAGVMNPSFIILLRLAEALGVDLNTLGGIKKKT